MDFVSDVEFDHLGAFVYSPEEGTKAAKFPGKVSKRTAESRCAKIMELQQEISQERGEKFIGHELEILIEEIDAESGDIWGRSYRDSPEVDGLVCVEGASNVKAGNVLTARIYDAAGDDLFGDIS